MEGQDKARLAGGYATQRGINYQNRVAAFFAACCLAERLALPELTQSPIKSIRCETGEPLADILLGFEDDGVAFVEVKRSIQLIPARMKPVVSHLIQQFLVSEQGTSGGKFPWRRGLDPNRDRLLLLTSSDTPENVTKHLAACLARITPESKPDDLLAIAQNQAETRAFNEFHTLTLEAWKDLLGTEPAPERVVRLYSLFRIASLDMEPGASGEQNAQGFLRLSVLTATSDSSQAWATLINLVGLASESRMLVTREELRREFQRSGLTLLSTPSYLADIRALREYTRLTLGSLDHLATLLVRGREVRIERPITTYLHHESDKQSLVVIGDPGAGKSGVLHELATILRREEHEEQNVVFLAADRLESSLKDELGLKNDLADILENWSGEKTGLLLIDALDAARGSNALLVLRDLIRRVVTTTGSRWRVVASIRVFDLRYSQELQQIFRRGIGEAGPSEYQDPFFFNIRHIKVPRFSPAELDDIRSKAPELDPIFDSATPALRELLDIPFNLRLVAEMLSDESQGSDFTGIETQVGLLSKYWLHRVIKSPAEGTARELVLADILRALVHERRLTVSKLRVPDAARTKEFASLCSDNVLVEQVANLHGRNIIGFSHHLLFDYAASRLVLSADFEPFLDSLSAERDLSLFLRPSIDLLFKEAWLRSRDEFWSYLNLFSAHDGVPAIAKIIGPAVIPELAKSDEDLAPLIDALSSQDAEVTERAGQWVIHVVGAVLAGVPVSSLPLWSSFCESLARCPSAVRMAAVCQSLIDHILERMKGGEPNLFKGRVALSHAAVRLLERFLAMERREGWVVGRTISNVMDLFRFNPQESAAAIRKLITPDEVRNRGAEQGHWIARKARLLFDIDPQLAAEIYLAFFGYEETSEEQTSMSGSQILAMNSNRRQDYHHTQWQLAQDFPTFLEGNFDLCAPIILAAVNDYIEREHKPRTPTDVITYWLQDGSHIVLVDYSAIWDSSSVRDGVRSITDAYFRKLEELANSAETWEVASATVSSLLHSAKYAYFPRRALIVAEKTGGTLASVIYPLLVSDSALVSYDLSSHIGEALRTNFGALQDSQRKTVELAIHRIPEGAAGEILEAKEHIRDRLLGCIAVDQLMLPESIARAKELATTGVPPNIRPYISGFRASPYSETDRMRERGIPLDAEPNASLREKAGRLWDFASRFANAVPQDSDVAEIEMDIDAVRDTLLANDGAIHQDIKSSAEAQLLAACATAAKLKSLDCATSLGQKVRAILFSGMDSIEPEYHPGYDAQFDRSPAWGAPVQRIEAAVGIGNLLTHKTCLDETLLHNVRRVLADRVPAVRFQVATRLLALYDKDIDSLWTILDTLAREEARIGVLAGVLYAVISPLSGRYKTEVIELVRAILRRTDLPDDGGDAVEWCYQITAGLYLWQNDAAAYAVVREITEGRGFRPQRAAHCLKNIREALTFVSDVPKATDAQIRQRAFGLLETIIVSVSLRIDRLLHKVEVRDRDENWQHEFQELAHLIDFIAGQLYFSSGAYDGTNSSRKLDDDARKVFWKESRSAISLLSAVAIPSAAHQLIEILQSFIPFDPPQVFHSIASVVRAAKSWGYQYESMAVDLLVKVTEVYLAEYRQLLQQDPQCREELIDILETFVSAGWPSARRLSYGLEEIFR